MSEKLISKFAFKFDLYRYTPATAKRILDLMGVPGPPAEVPRVLEALAGRQQRGGRAGRRRGVHDGGGAVQPFCVQPCCTTVVCTTVLYNRSVYNRSVQPFCVQPFCT